MRMNSFRNIVSLLVLVIVPMVMGGVLFGQGLPGVVEILDKIDQNMVYKSAYSEVEMNILIQGREISKSLTVYSLGNEKSFIEFFSPARDKGTKILKIADVVKVYYPSAERVMRLSGHMLRQSMMGSDFSFEDMTERAKRLREEYTGEVQGEEKLEGRACFVMVLTSKLDKQTYFTRKIWVDTERYLGLKEELYAKSGKLLKVMAVTEVKSYKNRFYPVRMVLEDKLRGNSKTEMIIQKIDFDGVISEDMFSERQLMKKQ